jgi:hypothetical protein
MKLKQYDRALEDMNAAVAFAPTDFRGCGCGGGVAMRWMRCDGSTLRTYRHKGRAVVMYNTQRYPEAKESFQRAIDLCARAVPFAWDATEWAAVVAQVQIALRKGQAGCARTRPRPAPQPRSSRAVRQRAFCRASSHGWTAKATPPRRAAAACSTRLPPRATPWSERSACGRCGRCSATVD